MDGICGGLWGWMPAAYEEAEGYAFEAHVVNWTVEDVLNDGRYLHQVSSMHA